MHKDKIYMRLAIRLARRAQGFTSPNPMVGSVVVKDGKIVGKGYHEKCGLAHAEVNTLNEAGLKAKGATLYVTLEPCDHYGRTPPCTDAIIKSGIKNVVIAMKDPNPINNGAGIKKLNLHGIKTTVGVLEDEARRLNKAYIKAVTKGMPFITVKVASSLDGKIATKTGDSRWITGEDSRRYVHGLRGKVDAVIVGVNTVIKDDPMLLSNTARKRQPARIIVDSHLKTPLNAKIFSDIDKSPVFIAVTKKTPRQKTKYYEAKGAKIIFAKSKKLKVDLKDLLKTLVRRGMTDILAEGGGELIASLVEGDLADRFLFFIAPKIIGGRAAKTAVEGNGISRIRQAMSLSNVRLRKFKKDILIEAERA